jgi:hypothetical protein
MIRIPERGQKEILLRSPLEEGIIDERYRTVLIRHDGTGLPVKNSCAGITIEIKAVSHDMSRVY